MGLNTDRLLAPDAIRVKRKKNHGKSTPTLKGLNYDKQIKG